MKAKGFTLLELLVALSLFAVLSIMAYNGLRSMVDTKTIVQAEAEDLARLQVAMTMISRDLEQAVRRGIRDEYGERRPAMSRLRGMDNSFEFTRSGWRNPAGRARSSLQRVAYRLEDEKLVRESWPVLDRAYHNKPFSQQLLAEIKGFEVAFLDQDDQWLEQWPHDEDLQNQIQNSGTYVEGILQLPRAVRIIIESADWGKITRLFVVAG